MAGQAKQKNGNRWELWTGNVYQRLEDMEPHLRQAAMNFLAGSDLKEELAYTTEESKRLANLGIYDKARKYAEVADQLEEYLKNGGDKHG